MQLRISYTNAGQTGEALTSPSVVIAWERKYQTKISRVADTGLGMEDLAFLAWEATRASGTVVPPFETWIEALEEITAGDEGRPTSAAPSAA